MTDGRIGSMPPTGAVPGESAPETTEKEGQMKGVKVAVNPAPKNELNSDQLTLSAPANQSILQRRVREADTLDGLSSIRPPMADTANRKVPSQDEQPAPLHDNNSQPEPSQEEDLDGIQQAVGDAAIEARKGADENAGVNLQQEAGRYIEYERLTQGKTALEAIKANLENLGSHEFPKDIVVKVTLQGSTKPIRVIPPDKAFLDMSPEKQEDLLNRTLAILDQRLSGELAGYECDQLDNKLDELQQQWVSQEKDKAAEEKRKVKTEKLERSWHKMIAVQYKSNIHVSEPLNEARLEKQPESNKML